MRRLIYILALLLFVSCYDDKGNYDYEDINTVAVELMSCIPCAWTRIPRLLLFPGCHSFFAKGR